MREYAIIERGYTMTHLGILGFGIVGKSALRYITTQGASLALSPLFFGEESFTVSVADKRTLTEEEQALCAGHSAQIIDLSITSLDTFFASCDFVIVSPGIDVSSQKELHQKKIINELDLFAMFFTKPVIAITGTLGKTTTTQLMSELLRLDSCESQNKNNVEQKLQAFCSHAVGCTRQRHITGGNIGYGMLDALLHQENIDIALLELSSFQLEDNKKFAPKIGLLTNLYANHLDRHKTIKAYFEAKWNLFIHQTPTDYALIGIEVIQDFAQELERHLPALKSQLYFISQQPLTVAQKMFIARHKAAAYFVQHDQLFLFKNEEIIKVVTLPVAIFELGFLSNWIFAFATMALLHKELAWLDVPLVKQAYQNLTHAIGEHRLELCATIQDVNFYNDSKATVIEATQAAIKKCLQQNRPLILVLGGISKGVDRSPLIDFIKAQQGIKKVISFGAGAQDLEGIENYQTLELAMDAIFLCMKSGDQVLFSPSGASFDLFNNYQHRGRVFKELVAKYI